MENSFEDQIKADKVRKRLKAMQGFYKHLMAYVGVNVFLLIIRLINIGKDENFFSWATFSTAICWGIGLFFHWYSVFGADIVLGKSWEERKIKEMMEKNDSATNKWE